MTRPNIDQPLKRPPTSTRSLVWSARTFHNRLIAVSLVSISLFFVARANDVQQRLSVALTNLEILITGTHLDQLDDAYETILRNKAAQELESRIRAGRPWIVDVSFDTNPYLQVKNPSAVEAKLQTQLYRLLRDSRSDDSFLLLGVPNREDLSPYLPDSGQAFVTLRVVKAVSGGFDVTVQVDKYLFPSEGTPSQVSDNGDVTLTRASCTTEYLPFAPIGLFKWKTVTDTREWEELKGQAVGKAIISITKDAPRGDENLILLGFRVLRQDMWWITPTFLLAMMFMILMNLIELKHSELEGTRPDIAWSYLHPNGIAATADLVTLVILPVWATGAWAAGIGDAGVAAVLLVGLALFMLRGSTCLSRTPLEVIEDAWRNRPKRILQNENTGVPKFTPPPARSIEPDLMPPAVGSITPKPINLHNGDHWMTRAAAQQEACRRWGAAAMLAVEGDTRYVGRSLGDGRMEILGKGRNWAGAFQSVDLAESTPPTDDSAPEAS
jgi:hypothetical protein